MHSSIVQQKYQENQHHHSYLFQNILKNCLSSLICSKELHCSLCCQKFNHQIEGKFFSTDFKETMTGQSLIQCQNFKTISRQAQLQNDLLTLKQIYEKSIKEKDEKIKALQEMCSYKIKQKELQGQKNQKQYEMKIEEKDQNIRILLRKCKQLQQKDIQSQRNHQLLNNKCDNLQKQVQKLQTICQDPKKIIIYLKAKSNEKKNKFKLKLSQVQQKYKLLVQDLLQRYESTKKKLIDSETFNLKIHDMLKISTVEKKMNQNYNQRLMEIRQNKITIEKEKQFKEELNSLVNRFVSLSSRSHLQRSSIMNGPSELIYQSYHRERSRLQHERQNYYIVEPNQQQQQGSQDWLYDVIQQTTQSFATFIGQHNMRRAHSNIQTKHQVKKQKNKLEEYHP